MTVAAAENIFRDLRGQGAAADTLSSALAAARVPHAYLFVGPDGVGKRTAFLKWCQALLCTAPLEPAVPCGDCPACRKAAGSNHPDVFRAGFQTQAALLKEPVEKQKSIKIDTVREMEKALRFKPLEGRVKIALVDPADDLVEAAAHALLKILEEPPPATHLVLLATDASKLLDTIRSRCQVVRFRPLSREDLLAVLEDRAGRGEPLDRSRFDEAVRAAEGSVGRALEILSETESLDFDWEAAPLSELLAWCDQFGRPRLGREAAADVLRRLLARFREEALDGRRPPEDMDRALAALTRVRRFASPSLALTALFLRLRRERKKRE